eukprot:6194189-Pleurochrysis_carterae.AAC.1
MLDENNYYLCNDDWQLDIEKFAQFGVTLVTTGTAHMLTAIRPLVYSAALLVCHNETRTYWWNANDSFNIKRRAYNNTDSGDEEKQRKEKKKNKKNEEEVRKKGEEEKYVLEARGVESHRLGALLYGNEICKRFAELAFILRI